MTCTLRMATGRVAAGEVDFTAVPRAPRPGGYGAVILHGAQTRSMGAGDTSWPGFDRLVSALARAGIPVVSPTEGLDYYANDTHMARIDASLQLLETLGAAPGRAHLIGASMGGGAAIRYAGLHPEKVASVNALIPMSSLVNLYRGNLVNGYGATFLEPIRTAWGLGEKVWTLSFTQGSATFSLTGGATASAADVGAGVALAGGFYVVQSVPTPTTVTLNVLAGGTASADATIYAPLPAGADLPTVAAGAHGRVPGRLFYAGNDPYIRAADVAAVAAAAGWVTPVLPGTGHENTAAEAWSTHGGGSDFSDLVAYLLAHES